MKNKLIISLLMVSAITAYADENTSASQTAAATTTITNPYFLNFCKHPLAVNRPVQKITPEEEAKRQAAWERACANQKSKLQNS